MIMTKGAVSGCGSSNFPGFNASSISCVLIQNTFQLPLTLILVEESGAKCHFTCNFKTTFNFLMSQNVQHANARPRKEALSSTLLAMLLMFSLCAAEIIDHFELFGVPHNISHNLI